MFDNPCKRINVLSFSLLHLSLHGLQRSDLPLSSHWARELSTFYFFFLFCLFFVALGMSHRFLSSGSENLIYKISRMRFIWTRFTIGIIHSLKKKKKKSILTNWKFAKGNPRPLFHPFPSPSYSYNPFTRSVIRTLSLSLGIVLHHAITKLSVLLSFLSLILFSFP